jgi:hypothetical protein
MDLFTAREYLKIDIANAFGLDKLSWQDRLAWFEVNQANLMPLMSAAEDPAMYYAGVTAWMDVLRGDPIGYPVSLDATASGLQLLAVLTGDRKAAEICNVVDVGGRMDAYTSVYKHMVNQIGEASKIKREDTKNAIMTALYGSTAVPKRVFGEGELLQVFVSSMNELTPAVWQLNQAFLDMWDPTADSYEWVLPDNFHVKIKVMTNYVETVHFLNEPFDVVSKVNAPMEKGRSLGANTIHSLDGMVVREITRRCKYDPKIIWRVKRILDDQPTRWQKQTSSGDDGMVLLLWNHYQTSGYLSARILDYLDYSNMGHVDPTVIMELIDSLPTKPFTVLSVHDCFRCLPTYANDLRKQYVQQLYLIARSNLLSFLLGQILKRPIQINKMDPNLHHDVLNANYALS